MRAAIALTLALLVAPALGQTTINGSRDIRGNLTVDGKLDVGTVETWANLDTTPDVSTGIYFDTFTNAITITDLDGGVAGQMVVVHSQGAITYDCTAAGFDCGSTDIVTAAGDTTYWFYDGTNWDLLAFKDQSEDMGTDAGGGGTPGGSPTEAQYNNSGSFGGISQLTYDGTNLTLTPTSGDNIAAEEIVGEVYNNSGATIFKCAAVYVSGFNVGADLPEISVADNDGGGTMPAVGLVYADIANGTSGFVVEFGNPVNLDTTTGEVWSAGDAVYVNASGTSTSADCGDTLTNVKPTGATELIQKVGTVERVNAVNGEIEVSGAGRSNDVPNAITVGTHDTINTDSVTLDNTWAVAQLEQIDLGADTAGDYVQSVTGANGIDAATCTGEGSGCTLTVDRVTAGSDGDSIVSENDSGLEFVGGKLSLLRGCDDEEILHWEETTDSWACTLIAEPHINAVEAPVDNDILSYNSGGGNFSWQTPAELGLLTAETNDLEATDPPNVLDDELYVGTGAGAGNWTAVPDCDATDGALNYDVTGGTFTCATHTHTADQVGTVTDGSYCQGGAGSVLDCDILQDAIPGAGHIDALAEIDGTLCGTNEILEDQGASWACIATPAGGSETNNLETTDPPNVLDNEVYVGTGAAAGSWIAVSLCGAGSHLDFDGASFGCETDDDVPESGDFTNLAGGAGITNSAGTLSTDSDENAFLHDNGLVNLTCGGGTQGRIVVTDNGELQFCDGTGTLIRLDDTVFGTVEGGSGGELADGTVDSNDLATANKKHAQPFNLFISTGLADTDDHPSFFRAPVALTITEIWCETDDATGTPSVNFQRDDGTPANICTADLDPTTSGATCTLAGAEDNLADGDRIDFVMTDAQSMSRLSCSIEYTVD